MKILLVDDSHIEHMLIASFLKEQDYQLQYAYSGEECIDCFEQFQPDLILLDVVMPGINGYEVAQRIRQTNGDWFPIIFLSGKASPEDILTGINAGGDDYLIKPIDKQVLLAKMYAMERIVKMRAQLVNVTTQLQQANEELKRLSLSDGLTGIANRRYLNEALIREIGRCSRQQRPISLLMIDIDHFKKYNDFYGHLEGDQCLKNVVQAINKSIKRSSDFIARYGGEEFCVVLPETNAQGAEIVANNIFHAIHKMALPHQGLGKDAIVTISMGVVTSWPDSLCNAEDILNAADHGLYQAKENGRNQYQFSE